MEAYLQRAKERSQRDSACRGGLSAGAVSRKGRISSGVGKSG